MDIKEYEKLLKNHDWSVPDDPVEADKALSKLQELYAMIPTEEYDTGQNQEYLQLYNKYFEENRK